MAADNISKFYKAFNAEYDNFKTEDDFRNYLKSAKRENMDKLYSAFNTVYDNFDSADDMISYLGWADSTAAPEDLSDASAVTEAKKVNPAKRRSFENRMAGVSTYEDRPIETSTGVVINPAATTAPVQNTPKQPEETPSFEEITQAYASAKEENGDFIKEYKKRWEKYQQDVSNDLVGPEIDEEKKWLDENNARYGAAMDKVGRLENEFNNHPDNPKSVQKAIAQAEADERENMSHTNPVQISTTGTAPGYDPSAHRLDESESQLYRYAAGFNRETKQVLKQGSKYDKGYDGDTDEYLWTGLKQFVGDALRNIDTGSFTMGADEGSARIVTRRTMDKSNNLVSKVLSDYGYEDEGKFDALIQTLNETGEALEKDADALDSMKKDLDSSGAQLKNMQATYESMAANGASESELKGYEQKYKAAFKDYNKKVGEYNKVVEKNKPAYEQYTKAREEYDKLMAGIKGATDQLTDGEKALIDAFSKYNDAVEMRKNDVSTASKAGQAAEQSAEFMLDFYLTGGLEALGEKIAVKATGAALKRKARRSLRKQGLSHLVGEMRPIAGIEPTFGAKLLGDVAVAGLRTAVLAPRNIKAYGDQLVEFTGKDLFGRYNFDRSHLNAFFNTALTQFIEYWSEGFGDYFGAGEQKIFKAITGRSPKTAIGKTLSQYRGSIGKFLDYGKFNGMFNEMLEELVGSSFNALAGAFSKNRFGDQEALKDFFAADNLATLVLSFLPMSAISARTNIKAYNQMKNRYDNAVAELNPYLESGTITREDLDELVSNISAKTPEEIKDKIVEISDKARQSNGGNLPNNFAQNLISYVEGTFALNMENETWEKSQQKMGVVNAYVSQYDTPYVQKAYDLNQLEAVTREAARDAGFSDDILNLDSYSIARHAEALSREKPEQAQILQAYAEAKGANAGLQDGYNRQTAQVFTAFEDAARKNISRRGYVIPAKFADGRQVYVVSNDASVRSDGKVSTPTGPEGMVMVRQGVNGEQKMVKASELSGAVQVDTDRFIEENKKEWERKRGEDYQKAKDTVSPDAKVRSLYQMRGQNVIVSDGNGVYQPIRIVRLTNEGEKVVIAGDAKFLQGLARAFNMDVPATKQIEVPAAQLWDMLSKEADGSLTTEASQNQQPETPATPAEAAKEETAPVVEEPKPQTVRDLLGKDVTINIDGTPTQVHVSAVEGGNVDYDLPDGTQKSVPQAEFERMLKGETPRVEETPVEEKIPVVEEKPVEKKAEEKPESKFKVDKNGETIFDAPGIEPLEAYDEIYGRLKKQSNADAFVTMKSKAADKAVEEAEAVIRSGEAELAEVEDMDMKSGEGFNAFLKRQEEARKKVNDKIDAAKALLPELQRKAAFWKELKAVADKNIKERERQERLDKEPRDLREYIAQELTSLFKGHKTLYLPSVLEVVGEDKRSELLSRFPGCFTDDAQKGLSVDDFVHNILEPGEHGVYVTDATAAISEVGDMLMSMGRKEMSTMIEEARKRERGEAKRQFDEAPAEEPIPANEAVGEHPEGTEVPEEDDLPASYVAENKSIIDETNDKLRDAKSDEEKVAIFQEMFDKMGTERTVVVTTDNFIDVYVKETGDKESVPQYKKDIADAKKANAVPAGFFNRGVVFVFADNVDTSEDAIKVFAHEAKHRENKETGAHEAVAKMGLTLRAMKDAVRKLSGTGAYEKRDSLEYLADELIAHVAGEAALRGVSAVPEIMREAGITDEKIVNFVKTNIEDGRRKESEHQPLASRGALDNVSSAVNGGQDGRASFTRPGEVEGQRLGTDAGSRETSGSERVREAIEVKKSLDDLHSKGVAANLEEGRFSVIYSPTASEVNEIASDLARANGVSKTKAKNWVKSETGLVPIILNEINSPYLNYKADDRYGAIKKNSDYPQGSADFNNICRKRLEFTQMYQRLQKQYPNVIITADDLAKIRNIMKAHDMMVACGLCYVEDRRSLLGEIATEFIGEYESGFENYGKGGKKKAENAEKFRKLLGDDKKEDLSIYDLVTLDGSTQLAKEHPGIYAAFQAFNNARGMQAGNLFQGYAEYKREILGWSKAHVKSVNDNGGLRMFSYSDFEAHHLIDVVQIIMDCARKGVMIQGYTKVPEFAKAVAKTGAKINRSLIPLGDTGIVDGKLAYDPVEGIDPNDPNFIESNDNIGNILIGINDEQIRLAMADPFIHFIIPYHSNQSKALRSARQVGAWTNYKLSQSERDAKTGNKADKGVNIYTDVLNPAEAEGKPIKNEKQFVTRFLAVCKEKGLIPRFDQFLEKNAKGDYVYTPGYYKFLVDFKLFDENGKILPQKPVIPEFDDAFNQQILNDYVKGVKENPGMASDEVYDEIVKALGLEDRGNFSFVSAEENEEYMKAVESDDMNRAQELVDDAARRAGYTINGYHGTTHLFNIFDRSKGNAEGNWGKGFYFTNNRDDAETNYANSEGPDLTNRIELLAEQMEWMDGYEDMDYEQRREEARKMLDGGEERIIEAAIRMDNPLVIGSNADMPETFFDYDYGYDPETDEYTGDESGLMVEFADAWNDVINDWEWEAYSNISPAEVMEYAMDGGLWASELEKKAREVLDSHGISDQEGNLASGEFLRQVFERMGFDGIIDSTVREKFGDARKFGRPMDGVGFGVNHIIAFTPEQIKLADPVTRDDSGNVIPLSERFLKDNEDIRWSFVNKNQEMFVSNAEKAVNEIKMEKATPEQWLKMLEKGGGIKAGEDKWLGLSDWLKASEAKTLTKDDVLSFIDENKIKIEEVHYSEKVEKQYDEAVKSYVEEFDGYVSYAKAHGITNPYEYAWDAMIDDYGDDFGMAFEINGDSIAPQFDWGDDYSDAAKYFLDQRIDSNEDLLINKTRLRYTTQGLKNKREIAMTVPTVEPYTTGNLPEVHFADSRTEGKTVAWSRFGDAEMDNEYLGEAQADYATARKELNDYRDYLEEKYKDSSTVYYRACTEEELAKLKELKDKEVEAHDWVDALMDTSSQVLFIDEIQSQRHQDAREQGYRRIVGYKDATVGEYRKMGHIFGDTEEADIINKDGEVIGTIVKDYDNGKFNGYYGMNTDGNNLTQTVNTEKEVLEMMENAFGKQGVPAAPFEKNWHELAMKRMLRLAAEEGYDYVAWTTGDQQAERYNLSQAVSEIAVKALKDGEYRVVIEDKYGSELEDYRGAGKIMNAKELTELVGKDLAIKLMTGAEESKGKEWSGKGKNPEYYTVKGDDLKIGGEGMKGFYDDMLVRFVNKYAKKWGASVKDDLVTLSDGAKLDAHILPVTDEMKASVMEGQPMFSFVSDEKAKELEAGKKETGYRNVVITDYLNMGSPMAKALGNKGKKSIKTSPFTFNRWEQADEHPEIADDNGKVSLKKGGDLGSVDDVDYNPYIHIRPNPVNTQFKQAWKRNDLVYISTEYPESELTSGYHAEKAALPVGRHPWNGGDLILSRYDKPTGIVDWEEVADAWMKEVDPSDMTFDRIPPALLPVLEKKGAEILPPQNGQDKGACLEAYNAWANGDIRAYEAWRDTGKGPKAEAKPISDAERAEIASVAAENVANAGIDNLFGKKAMGNVMSNVYASVGNEGRNWINSFMVENGIAPGTKEVSRAIGEYMTHLAESEDFYGKGWEAVKQIVNNAVVKKYNAEGVELNDEEVAYILRTGAEYMRNPKWLDTIQGKAKDTLMKRRYGIGETAEEGRFSFASADNAKAYYEDKINHWTTAFKTEFLDADYPAIIGMQSVMQEKFGKDWKKKWAELPDDENYPQRHNQAGSRAETRVRYFQELHWNPLLDQFYAVRDRLMKAAKGRKQTRKQAYDRVLDYLYAVSGIERNQYENDRIEQQKQDAIEAARKSAEEEREKVRTSEYDYDAETQAKLIADINEKLAKKEEEIVKKYDAKKRDWSGLTALMGLPSDQWQQAEKDAQAMVDAFVKEFGKDKDMLDELWKRIRSCTDFNLEDAYENGLLTREEFERLHGTSSQPRMWKFYLPLRGFAEQTAEEAYRYSYASVTEPGGVVKKMKGRWTEADNPLANILAIALRETVQGQENWARQALRNFTVRMGENSLLKEREPWFEKDPDTGEWRLAEPYETDPATGEPETLEDFEKRMQDLRSKEEPLAKKGRYGLKLDKILANKARRNEHLIRLKVDGMEKMIWVNANPAMAQSVMGRTRRDGWFLRNWRNATRFISNFFTSYSLKFSGKNAIRDKIFSAVANVADNDPAYGMKYEDNWIANTGYGAGFAAPMIRLVKMWESGALLKKEEDEKNGKVGKDGKKIKLTERERMFIDFMQDGGQTGYVVMQNADAIKKQLEKSLGENKNRKSGDVVRFPIADLISLYAKVTSILNEAFELLTRFTAYETSRDMGRSRQRAAADAKEISVNFNRRGAQSGSKNGGFWGGAAQAAGIFYYFFNAGIQGVEKFFRMHKQHPLKMTAVDTAFFMMGFANSYLNAVLAGLADGGDGDGDDDNEENKEKNAPMGADWYWNIPAWVRRGNVIIGSPFKKLKWGYLALPLPVEFKGPFALGELAGAWFQGKLAARTPKDNAIDMMGVAADMFPVNPVEGYAPGENILESIERGLAPDLAMFWVDLKTNSDYTGRPLWRENPYNPGAPKSHGSFASTPKALVKGVNAVNQAMGWDVAPGVVRDALKQYGGGFYNTAEDVYKMIYTDAEHPFRWENVPFVSGFTGHVDADRRSSFAEQTLRQYKKLSDDVVKKINIYSGYDFSAKDVYEGLPQMIEAEKEGKELPKPANEKEAAKREQMKDALKKAKVEKILLGEKYVLGQMYYEGSLDQKEGKTGKVDKRGVVHIVDKTVREDLKTLRKDWDDAKKKYDEDPTDANLKAMKDAYEAFSQAEVDLATKLMEEEFKNKKKREGAQKAYDWAKNLRK